MNNLTRFILTGLLLGLAHCDLAPIIGPGYDVGCPNDFGANCALQCPNGNYLLDGNGCPTCACAITCPEIKCRANCGDDGYVIDENGCQTCKCVSPKIQCARVMCRMYCQYGFKRDENGCEYCACNQLPQQCPILNCENSCSNGYRKDYSGCQTCDCIDEPQQRTEDKCLPLTCDLNCKYGVQRDESGCQICACNSCPPRQCRMFCTYGFRKNPEDGCDICECDWTPVAEKIQCDERIPCPETRICNLNLRLCEKVNPDLINWFLYDFQVKNEIFKDEKFIQTFKNGLIYNIAAKYGLIPSQITVSSVEENGLTSFQIMPYFSENMLIFQDKMDQIDTDLNSHEFRKLLPAVTLAVQESNDRPPSRFNVNNWCQKFKNFTRSKLMISTIIVVIVIITLIVGIGLIAIRRRYTKLSIRSESKTPIYDTSYHLAADDEDNYHAVSAPDGTKYVVVATDDMQSSNDKRALV
jgi:hypothetical protein